MSCLRTMMNGRFLFIVLMTAAALIGGCVAYPGVYHTVGQGETFWRICKTYGADPQEVAELNDIQNPANIKTGEKIFIPRADKRLNIHPPGTTYVPDKTNKPDVKNKTPKYAKPPVKKPGVAAKNKNHKVPPKKAEVALIDKEGLDVEKVSLEKGRFIWPVRGEIESRFGMRSSGRHDGIDIKAPEGAPVKAAGDGTVVYSNSNMRGYGNVVIVRHKDDFYTVYAHNSKNKVGDGDKVAKGDVIALVGKTGNASNNHLHFEVRQGKKVRNPLFFLP